MNDCECVIFFVTDFRRAVTALAIICLMVMVAAIAFTWYSILQPRYIFKRLAGCLQIGCGLFIFSSYLIQSTVYVHYLLCMNASLSSFISLSVWLSVCLSVYRFSGGKRSFNVTEPSFENRLPPGIHTSRSRKT